MPNGNGSVAKSVNIGVAAALSVCVTIAMGISRCAFEAVNTLRVENDTKHKAEQDARSQLERDLRTLITRQYGDIRDRLEKHGTKSWHDGQQLRNGEVDRRFDRLEEQVNRRQ